LIFSKANVKGLTPETPALRICSWRGTDDAGVSDKGEDLIQSQLSQREVEEPLNRL